MNEKELLTGVLAKTLDQSPEEVSDLLYNTSDESDEVTLKENAFDLVLEKDVERVQKLKSSAKPDKEKIKEIRDQEKFNAMDGFEKKLKAHYGLESTSKGLDLVQEIVNTVSECDITDDKVKNHPLYLELEKTRTTDDYDALHTEYEDFKLNQDRSTRLGRIRSDVLGIFPRLNPVESKNSIVASNQRENLFKMFNPYDYELKDDGNHLILQNGSRLEDKHGNPIKFEDFVKDMVVSLYDLAVSTDRGQSGNTSDTSSTTRVDVPGNFEEYLAQSRELVLKGDQDGHTALKLAWEESQNR